MSHIRNQRDIIDRLGVAEALESCLDGGSYKSERRQDLVEVLKTALARGTDTVRERFEAGGPGTDVLRGNAFLIDQLVRVIFDFANQRVYPAANLTTAEQLSIVAVGGYGRAELAPYSDIDLMFLLPYKQTPHGDQIVEFMLYVLWDLGLKVGHATRSTDETMRLAKDDVTVRTSLLDARWIWGDQALFQTFKERFQEEITSGSGARFVQAKLDERDGRHERMGDTRYVVEPNIKEGKGGLRDLQTLYWLAKHLYGMETVNDLVRQNVFTRRDANRFKKALDFLLTVRCHLHYIAGRAEERLTFDAQTQIAARLEYTDRAGISGVERFMKHYFLIAKDVGDLTRVLCALLEEQQKKRRGFFRLPLIARRKLSVEGFKIDGDRLTVEDDEAFRQDPVKILRLFYEAQENELDIHPQALRLVNRDLKLVNKTLRANPDANQLFMDIMTSRKDPETSLRCLNESGVFGKFIPDFGRVVAQMQYDMYHTYTVDEHTIRAIGMLAEIEAGALEDEAPAASAAIHEIESRRALYLAVMVHDIAKGRGGSHSELGAEIALKLGPRLGLSEEETETVSWLVLHHLTMSHVAFKRDIDDPKTITDFIDIIQSVERLRLLLVLTVADIRAVGPGIWNNWKASLLRNLYHRALAHMSGERFMENREARIEAAKDDLRAALSDWPADALEAHIETGYPRYWLAFDRATHCRHAEIVQEANSRNLNIHIETRVEKEDGFTEIVVYSHDHPGLFSKIAGAMGLSGATIVDAKIVTLANGMALDQFSILDINHLAYDDPARLKKLWGRIEDAVAGKLNPGRQLDHEGSPDLVDRSRAFTVAPRVLIDNKASSTNSVIEVNGRDRPGFLHDVTSALTELGLQISSAHVTTYGERVVDVFYVVDVFGTKIENEEKLARIRERLLAAVARTAETEIRAAE